MTGARVAWVVFLKDLRLDLRTRDRVGHMAVFSALVVVLMAIALPTPGPESRTWLPVLLWVVVLLTALLGLARSFQAEVDEEALAVLALAPCDRGWIFLGKAGANGIALLGIEIWTALLFSLFLGVSWTSALPAVLGVGVLGAVGVAGIGTLLSAMSTSARYREFLLPVLLFPLVLPVLVLASFATADSIAGNPVPDLLWGALALYAWISVVIPYLVFDYLLED